MGQPSLSTLVCVNTQPSLHSRVRARCPSILPMRPSVSEATTGTWTPSISTYIFGIFCLQTTGRTSCLARPISWLSLLGDLRANGLGGPFDGFGGDVQTGEHFHRLAPRSEPHLTAHHGLHASHPRRGFQTSDIQFDVSWILSFRAIVA